MFYCDECAEKRQWPNTMSKSKGRCEMCGKEAVCNDLPCDALQAAEANRQLGLPAFLARVLREVGDFDESLFPPNEPVHQGERVIGIAPSFCRKLFAYARYCHREAKQIQLDIQFTTRSARTTESAARLEEMSDTHRLLMALFWACTQDEFRQWGAGEALGVREDWSIVTCASERAHPIQRLLENLGGE
jgi:hypothetical protein